MPVQKQGYNIPFGQGLDLKTDPNQVVAGKMLALQNTVFNNGQLTKRDGFGDLTTLPTGAAATTLTTLNGNLLATGASLYAFSQDTNQWFNRGSIQPVDLNVIPLVRNAQSQSIVDSVVADNGLVCVVYKSASAAYYQINDSVTGQAIISQTALASTATNVRVHLLGRNFIITYIVTVAASPHLEYIAIPTTMPDTPGSRQTISTQVSSLNAGYDGKVNNDRLYLAWNGNDGGGALRLAYLTSTLVLSSAVALAGSTADLVSVTVDTSASTSIIWISFWDASSGNIHVTARNQNLTQVLGVTTAVSTVVLIALTSVAKNGIVSIYYDNDNDYSYAAVQTDFISKQTVTQAGVLGTPAVVLRSVGLASKAFYNSSSTGFMLVTYGGAFQPTYFLMDENGNISAKLAYSNGGGFMQSQVLPSVTITDDVLQVPYLIKDLLVSVNKAQGAADVGGIYAQTGINLATMSINTQGQSNEEMANALHLTGGILWEYDSVKPVEHGFHVWPEDLTVSTSGAGGLITAQQYYYVFCYEWTDAQGKLHRSAPSIPVGQVTTGATSTNTINVPTLRITYKTSPNAIRLVGYRWSTAQQVYYQFTSISSPTLNNPAVDSVAVTDTLADSSILGNSILYTTGGVIENIAAPASTDLTTFKSRMWVIDAEDPLLMWYSKQVVSGVPVEFSDLLTVYVAPWAGASNPTGPLKCLSNMDDKLIMFKADSIGYLTGNGPDNTGAQNDFSEPTFISSTVGCSNPNSIVFTPLGIMFQSDKGIWLLGRDLSTKYIGDYVELYNDATVVSALTIPSTNQVCFTLDNGVVLMYDYYYNQWGTFNNVPAVSATLYQGLHTYLRSTGLIRQQTPGVYLDGTDPVLIKFTTAWLKLTNLQGFQRAYCFYLLGTYLSAHKINVQIAYDYDPSIAQSLVITPTNVNTYFGDDTLFGSGSPFGGTSSVEQWRIFFNQQKCQSVQITMTEIYDATRNQPAGEGISLSGLNLVFGGKSTYPKLAAKNSAG